MKFENENKKRLVLSSIAAILFFIAAVGLAPCLGIEEGGKISLSRMQLAYGLLSVLLAAALYVWGVGYWSRFEPPPDKSPDPKPPSPDATQGASLAPKPAAPAPSKGGN